MHRNASTTNVTRRVARRLPHGHAAALLRPLPRFTLTPPLALSVFSTCLFLPCSKERYKNNETTKETPPSHSLSRAVGRRWVLASLSVPRARVDLCHPCPDTTTRTRRRTGKPKFWRVLTTQSFIVNRPLSCNTYVVHPDLTTYPAPCQMCTCPKISTTRPSTHEFQSRATWYWMRLPGKEAGS